MPISPDKVRFSSVIEKEDKKALERIAREQDRSLNYIVNQAIKEYLKKRH